MKTKREQNENDRKLSRTIRELRESKGYTQSEMADKLGMERANYHNLESNRGRNISVFQLEEIAQALGANVIELLSEGNQRTTVVDATEATRLDEQVVLLQDRLNDKTHRLESLELVAKEAILAEFNRLVNQRVDKLPKKPISVDEMDQLIKEELFGISWVNAFFRVGIAPTLNLKQRWDEYIHDLINRSR